MTAASIDNADGTPIVNVAFMKPRSGSLESMGTIAEDSGHLSAATTTEIVDGPRGAAELLLRSGTVEARRSPWTWPRPLKASSTNPWASGASPE